MFSICRRETASMPADGKAFRFGSGIGSLPLLYTRGCIRPGRALIAMAPSAGAPWYVRRVAEAEVAAEHFDVLIMGAGLSGIDAAYHLQKFCPNKSYVILEQRDRIGGTWDLFRYPGIRSDSDMLTMGYSFRPWTSPKAISAGDAIREYITATARDEEHRPAHPFPTSDSARRVVLPRGAGGPSRR